MCAAPRESSYFLPPVSQEKNPEPADAALFSSSVCPGHHCPAGTPALTESMCWPHPAQVVFPQTLQLTGRHIAFSSLFFRSAPADRNR